MDQPKPSTSSNTTATSIINTTTTTTPSTPTPSTSDGRIPSNPPVAIPDVNTTKLQKANGLAKKDSSETDLKSLIIDFMREKPVLWDSRHLCYKDHKRRDHEFQLFSKKIGYPVQEIKRVWHVLRTNFFRAHKMLQDKRPGQVRELGNEKLWKYYLAMSYILDGTQDQKPIYHLLNQRLQKEQEEQQQEEEESPKDVRRTRSCKINSPTTTERDSRASTSASANASLCIVSPNSSLNDYGKNCQPTKSPRTSNMSSSLLSHNSFVNHHTSLLNKSTRMPMIDPMEADDDNLYARSLSLTLKKFDPTTKEIIKLKFQQIIVNYMQQLHQKPNPQADTSGNDKSGSSLTQQQRTSDAKNASSVNKEHELSDEKKQ